MNIGRLDKRVTIQRYQEIEDSITHFTKQKWVDLKTVWSSMNNLHGKEYWTAKQYQAENTVEFIIRFSACPDLSVKDRLKINNKMYNIISIDNVLYQNNILKIRAVEKIHDT